jgi:hypothetical protein
MEEAIKNLLDAAAGSPTGIWVESPNRVALRTFILRAIAGAPTYAGLTCIFSPINPTHLIIMKLEALDARKEDPAGSPPDPS